jgi:hypothetical protein
MTIDIYGHLIPGSKRDAINQLDAPPPSATYQNKKAVTPKDYDHFFISGAEGRNRYNIYKNSMLLKLLHHLARLSCFLYSPDRTIAPH